EIRELPVTAIYQINGVIDREDVDGWLVSWYHLGCGVLGHIAHSQKLVRQQGQSRVCGLTRSPEECAKPQVARPGLNC
ncbi:hypothetical protein IRJ41_023946, partial [Triplophysa rosa]